MRDVVAGASHALHQRLDLVEHAVDDDRQPIERIIHPLDGESLPQLASDDALNTPINLIDALLRADAQQRGGARLRQCAV